MAERQFAGQAGSYRPGMMAHFAIRCLMHEAALKADEDPDRLSFLHSVKRDSARDGPLLGYSPLGAETISAKRSSMNCLMSGSFRAGIALTLAA